MYISAKYLSSRMSPLWPPAIDVALYEAEGHSRPLHFDVLDIYGSTAVDKPLTLEPDCSEWIHFGSFLFHRCCA